MQCNEHESSQYRMRAATQSEAARSSYCLPSGEWISRPNCFPTPIIVPVPFPYWPPAPPPPYLPCPPKPRCRPPRRRRRRRPCSQPLGGSFFFPGGGYNSIRTGYGRTEKEDWNRHGLRQWEKSNSSGSTRSLNECGAKFSEPSVDGECSFDGSDEDYSECSGSESDRDDGWRRPTHHLEQQFQ